MRTEPRVYFGALAACVVATGLFVGLAAPTHGGAQGEAGPAEYNTTVDGVKYTVHPSELVRGCLQGKDCIGSIDDPQFSGADEADFLRDDEQVIGVVVDGEARAYPLRILRAHEIVNDEIAGEPVAVTYCPLCRSGLVFSRTVDGRTLTFGVSGHLLNANLVMYDRQTDTYWSQVRGEAIVGEQVPASLTVLPSTITTWAEWRAGHPDTVVLTSGADASRNLTRNRYEAYQESESVGYGVRDVDDRLHPKAIVYGVSANGSATAYPESVVERRGAINDEVGGVPVLVVQDPVDGSVRVFVRAVDGETLAFTRSGDALRDGSGNRWSFDGEALAGPHEGRELERLDTHGFFWFAWSRFNPDTGVYQSPG